jgi:hypothetical protein
MVLRSVQDVYEAEVGLHIGEEEGQTIDEIHGKNRAQGTFLTIDQQEANTVSLPGQRLLSAPYTSCRPQY